MTKIKPNIKRAENWAAIEREINVASETKEQKEVRVAAAYQAGLGLDTR
jgi:hypothetical protein